MKILVMGVGYIGISTAIYFTKAGCKVYGYDLDMEKLDNIKKGTIPQKDLEKWLSFNPKKYLKKIEVSHNPAVLKSQLFDAIFIAIPTEKAGEPWFEPLEAVIENIKESPNKDTLTIIESTLTPGVADKYIEPHLKNFVISPRRDWFTAQDKTLETLPRIVGGNTKENTKKAEQIIGKVCETLYTCNYKEAQLIKACENSLRHIGAVFAQQLAWAYPEIDTRKVLKLAGTKWNIPEYFANILGTSGYCIPVSSKYIKYGAKNPNELGILDSTLDTDKISINKIVRTIMDNLKPKKIAILGMAYLGDIKVHVLSGGLRFTNAWEELHNIRRIDDETIIKMHDTLYSKEEIKTISGKESLDLKDLKDFDVIIVASDHAEYKKIDKKELIIQTKDCKLLLDNCGIWEDIRFACPYTVPGRKGWLNKLKGKING